MSDRLTLFLLFFPVFLFSLSFHESAHAWVANRLGDPTAKLMGRLTLNPIPHMDFLGTLLLPLISFMMPAAVLPIAGWGKPVPVDSRNLRGGLKGNLWVAAAGPASNMILAAIFATVFRLLAHFAFKTAWSDPVYGLLEVGVFLNLGLAFFNLVPIHPLDGGNIILGLLPYRYLQAYDRIARYGMLILIAAFYLGFMRILRIPVNFFASILLP